MGLGIEFFSRDRCPKGAEKDEIVAERHAGGTAGVVTHGAAQTAVYGAVHFVFPHPHIADQRPDVAKHRRLSPHIRNRYI